MPYQRPRVPIGRRRERVQIQEAVKTADGLGGYTQIQWKTVAEPWAAVEALDERIRERVEGAQVDAKLAYHITVPFSAIITPERRMIVRDTTMEIHSAVDDEGYGRRMVVYVTQVQT